MITALERLYAHGPSSTTQMITAATPFSGPTVQAPRPTRGITIRRASPSAGRAVPSAPGVGLKPDCDPRNLASTEPSGKSLLTLCSHCENSMSSRKSPLTPSDSHTSAFSRLHLLFFDIHPQNTGGGVPLFFTGHKSRITGHVLSARRHSRLCVSRLLFSIFHFLYPRLLPFSVPRTLELPFPVNFSEHA
jgi:hypothetical protein